MSEDNREEEVGGWGGGVVGEVEEVVSKLFSPHLLLKLSSSDVPSLCQNGLRINRQIRLCHSKRDLASA